jgi:hypothetical protein
MLRAQTETTHYQELLMSENTRIVALSFAVQHLGPGGDTSKVIPIAEAFNDFLLVEGAPSKTSVPGKEPTKPNPQSTTTKASDKQKEAAKAPAKTEEQLAAETIEKNAAAEQKAADDAVDAKDGVPTEQALKDKITEVIAANKRDQAVAILKAVGAKSASSVKPEDRVTVISQLDEVLLTA